MSNITHLNVFDFDETLFRVPAFTCKEAVGMTPYEWFDNPISLKKPLNVVAILNTIEKTWNDKTAVNYLITHRAEECKKEVFDLLKKSGCKFKEILFLERTDRKALKLLEILDTNPHTISLDIYEDSFYEILQYAAILKDADLPIEVNFIFVDKRKTVKFPLRAIQKLLVYGDTSEKIRLL